jgi:hypothetical protein
MQATGGGLQEAVLAAALGYIERNAGSAAPAGKRPRLDAEPGEAELSGGAWRTADWGDPGGGAIEPQLVRLRARAGRQFHLAAAALLARRLAGGTLALVEVLAAIEGLRRVQEFDRQHFVSQLLTLPRRPALAAVLALHEAAVLPFAEFLAQPADRLPPYAADAPRLLRNPSANAEVIHHFCTALLAAQDGPEAGGDVGHIREVTKSAGVISAQSAPSCIPLPLEMTCRPYQAAESLLRALASEPARPGAPAPGFAELGPAELGARLAVLRAAATSSGDAARAQLARLQLGCLSRAGAEPPAQAAVRAALGAEDTPPPKLQVAREELVAALVEGLGDTALLDALGRAVRRDEVEWPAARLLLPAAVTRRPALRAPLLKWLQDTLAEVLPLAGEGDDEGVVAQAQLRALLPLLQLVTFGPAALAGGLQPASTPAVQQRAYVDAFRDGCVWALGTRRPGAALLRALTVQVPYEAVLPLQLQIGALRTPAAPAAASDGAAAAVSVAPVHRDASTRQALSEYTALAKTRLADLGHRYSGAVGGGGSTADGDVRAVVRGYIEEHAHGGALPGRLSRDFMFRRNWWTVAVTPIILSPLSPEDGPRAQQRALLAALAATTGGRAKGPFVLAQQGRFIPPDAVEIFDLACAAGDAVAAAADGEEGADADARAVALLRALPAACAADRLNAGAAITALLGRVDAAIEVAAERRAAAAAAAGQAVEGEAALAQEMLEAFCGSYDVMLHAGHAHRARPLLWRLANAVRRLAPAAHFRLRELLAVGGGLEPQQCAGLGMYLAVEVVRCGGARLAARVFRELRPETGGTSELLFLRFAAAYVRAVFAAADAVALQDVAAAAATAEPVDEAPRGVACQSEGTEGDEGEAGNIGADSARVGWLPLAELLRPAAWLTDRAQYWLDALLQEAAEPEADEEAADGHTGAGWAAQPRAGWAAAVADWGECMERLGGLGLHARLADVVPLADFVRLELTATAGVGAAADRLPLLQQLDYMRSRVTGLHAGPAGGGAAAVCAALLGALVTEPVGGGCGGEPAALLLLLQELAADGGAWLPAAVRRQLGRAGDGERLWKICQCLGPELLWAASPADSTGQAELRLLLEGLLLQRQPWVAATADHVLRGLLAPCRGAVGAGRLRAVRAWVESWPQLVLALLRPGWRRVLDRGGLVAGLLGEEVAEEAFGDWLTMLALAERAVAAGAGDAAHRAFAAEALATPSLAAACLAVACLARPQPGATSQAAALAIREAPAAAAAAAGRSVVDCVGQLEAVLRLPALAVPLAELPPSAVLVALAAQLVAELGPPRWAQQSANRAVNFAVCMTQLLAAMLLTVPRGWCREPRTRAARSLLRMEAAGTFIDLPCFKRVRIECKASSARFGSSSTTSAGGTIEGRTMAGARRRRTGGARRPRRVPARSGRRRPAPHAAESSAGRAFCLAGAPPSLAGTGGCGRG